MTPQVVAHRGGGGAHEAEHTLAAYAAALDAGADALECDVRLTADGHLVCVHDRTLRRVAGHPGLVSTMDLADLTDLDVTRGPQQWRGLDDDLPLREAPLGTVLTLRMLLELVRASPRPVQLAIETKHPTRYGGLVEHRLVRLLGEYGWTGADSPVRVMSFSFTALQRTQRLAPELPLVQLLDRAAYWPLLRRAIGPDWAFGPGIKELLAHPELGPRISEAGHDLHVWTVNRPEELDLCLELGVRSVITDRPTYVRGLLDQR
ncbi:glycerophosphodiester phosphodiesterase [Nocardioides insulae]|uniref:glycerophosphodiester phosphodiesterase n=1 Tax=Nocardioides insulae TaxID=394734 RepID=UPI00041A761A|nr:glycerophosphodiester phosphodiesterase family protein [Nocardioides insulae]